MFADLRLWSGAGRRTGSVEAHDPGSSDSVLSSTRDSDGSASLFCSSGRLERRLHFWRTAGKTHPLPGAEPGTAGELPDGSSSERSEFLRLRIRVRDPRTKLDLESRVFLTPENLPRVSLCASRPVLCEERTYHVLRRRAC